MKKLGNLLHILGAICNVASAILLLLALIIIAIQGAFLAYETNHLILSGELVLSFVGCVYAIYIWKKEVVKNAVQKKKRVELQQIK